ncbi:S41 family peptidase [Cellulosilyticum ruminicola]|uniref:S41 family peptidase n=1 Tax=Cellulosilyticum ruminicola TaxID=425254 RepID=UPI0006D133A6|nr:S41 family peptidase [Cellulosilyticum ruminicola]
MRHKKIKGKKIVVIMGIVTILAGCSLIQGSEGATFSKLKFLSRQINKLYIGELNQQKLNDGIYTGYVEGLENPTSYYLDEIEYKANLAYEEGKAISTGLAYTWGLDGNHLVITDVVANSPADKAGIKIGEQIVKVDNVKVIYSNEAALAKILSNAEEGSSNTYIIRKDATSSERKIKLTKALIEKPSLKSDQIGEIGYIKLKNITSGTSNQVKAALDQFKKSGQNKVILDIRDLYSNNLEETFKLCDIFMDKTLAFKIKDKEGKMKDYYTTDGKVDNKVVILINNRTMGIIEALPIAVKGNIPLVGSHSAGSGYVSKLFALDDGSGLRLATGILCTKEDKEVKEGDITADKEVAQTKEAIIQLMSKGKMSYECDTQLQEAMKLLEKF